MKKILHISNWYPNFESKLEGIFVKEQFQAFSDVTDAKIINIQVRKGAGLKFKSVRYSEKEYGYYFITMFNRSIVIEFLTTLLVLIVLFKERATQYQLIHFHISYPLLVHYRWWKKFLKTKIIISEHWSAYNRNFGLPLTSKKLDHIKYIFNQQIPLICVSKALANDIAIFSRNSNINSYILPNVIDLESYTFTELRPNNEVPLFFIVNSWSNIKNPFPLLEAICTLVADGLLFNLIIGGDGDLLDRMKIFVNEHKLEKYVDFVGRMEKTEINSVLAKSNAYLFSSNYETFSVVCAQALCCGVPLIGPAIPAILEYAGKSDIQLVETNDASGWVVALRKFLSKKQGFNHRRIAQKARGNFSVNRIQQQYLKIVDFVTLSNKEKYTQYCETQNGMHICVQPWWLDIVCEPYGWDVALSYKDGLVVGSMPYLSMRNGFIFESKNIPFSQQLGPWVSNQPANYSKALAWQKDVMSDLIGQLPDFDIFTQNWSHKCVNWLPFYWQGFNQHTRYTYLIGDLNCFDNVWANVQQNIYSDALKAESRFCLKVLDDLPLNDLILLCKMTFTRQGIADQYDYEMLTLLEKSCSLRKCSKVLIAVDDNGNHHAGLFMVWDESYAYYLVGGSNPDFKTSGAMSLVLKEAIRFSSTVTKGFDFCGSMIEPIERFFRAFGGKQTPYFNVSKSKSKFIRLFLKLKLQ